eukprot:jgi/Botrbrau1/2912/Bobra.0036s0049.1
MVKFFPCFTGPKRHAKQINLSDQPSLDGNLERPTEQLNDQLTTSFSWPWLHLDYKGNTDLAAPDSGPLSKLGIPERDIRLILSSQGKEESLTFILTRGSTILVAIGALRMIIAHDQLYVLSCPRGIQLETNVCPTTDNDLVRHLVCAIRGQTIQLRDRDTEPGLPYEMRAMEAALSFAVDSLASRTSALLSTESPFLQRLPASVSREGIERMRGMKRHLHLLNGQATRLKLALARLLKSDSQVAGLCLTQRALHASESRGSRSSSTDTHSVRRCAALLDSYLVQVNGNICRLGEARGLAESAERGSQLQIKLNTLLLGH